MEYRARRLRTARDLAGMTGLARRFAGQHLHVVDLPYRFSSWALEDPHNARLWFAEDGALGGWVVLQTPFWAVDFACPPEAEADLLPRMLDWASRRAAELQTGGGGLPAWFANVFAGQAGRIQALEKAGFACQAFLEQDAWSKVLMSRPGQLAVGDFPLPPGYTLRPLGGAREAPAYVELHQAVFETRNMRLPWRLRTLRQPAYRPELDLVISAPDGTLAAFCIAWYDEPSHTGQIEPLGAAAGHRRRGLAQAILAEALRRLQALGAQQVLVETDNYRDAAFQLYESAGFRVTREVLVYRKDFTPQAAA